ADVDDSAALTRNHPGKHCFGNEEGAGEINGKNAVPILLAGLVYAAEPSDAGVVENRIDGPERMFGRPHRFHHAFRARYIGGSAEGANACAFQLDGSLDGPLAVN